jgi:oligoendopeptidase F
MADANVLPLRSEVPLEQTWNLERLFPTPLDWDAACRELTDLLPRLAAFQGHLSESPQTLVEFLDLYQQAGALRVKIIVYADNASAVDKTDQAAAARVGQKESLEAQFQSAVAFFKPELVAVGFERLRGWMQTTPELAFLAHFVDRLEVLQAHIRSGEVEQAMALAMDPFSGVPAAYDMLNSADLKFKPAIGSDGAHLELAQASSFSLIAHPDREVRRTAWENYADAYLGMKNTYAAILTTSMKQDVFKMRLRGFSSSLESALGAYYLPEGVFHNVLTVFQANLPTWHRYWRVRRRALGYSHLHVYDVEAPLTDDNPVVLYRQAVDWICAGMAPLGESYVDVLRRGCLEQRWVDWACNKGKVEGAFSSGIYGTDPYLLLSYTDDLSSLSTLAHELGHSMHTYHTQTTQPYIYSEYGSSVAEVASNFNQAMVREYLFRTQPERNFQIALIEEAMSNFHRYFFIMPTLARFELELHTRLEQNKPVNAAIMIDLMADLFEEGYGGEMVYDRERLGITWAQFAHLYMNFYVFQYAIGISAAHALAKPILAGDAGAAERYLDFLRAGDSLYPLDALRLAGADFSGPEPIEQGFAYLASLVDRLESLF